MKRNVTWGPGRHGQRGISLVVGLIMLILLTLLAISAFQASNVNLRIAGNMQVRQETLAAAQTATEAVLSTPAFIDPATPPAPATVALNGASYTVNFTPAPACTSVVDIPSVDLVPKAPETCESSEANRENCKCVLGETANPNGIYPLSAASLCANTRWAVIADVADPNTSARTTLEHGVAVRMAKGKALEACP